MSTPDATGTRQRRTGDAAEDNNPASLSTDPTRKVPRNKPQVKPPFSSVSFGKFMTYLILCLVALAAFYAWRFTVWAAAAGGYWNLMTGQRAPATSPGDAAFSAAAKVGAKASRGKTSTGAGAGHARGGDVESQILQLANALGVKPADLSSAIRPLIDPSAPNPAEAAKMEAEKAILQAKAAGGGKAGGADDPAPPGILAQMGEVLLD